MTVKARIVNNVYSNTSHVTINRYSAACTAEGGDSNTSHVTINHVWITQNWRYKEGFKYISCYY